LISVPNEKLANAALKNWNRRQVGRRIKMHIGVTYGSDRQKLTEAIEAIRAMLQQHPGIVSSEKYDRNMYEARHRKEKKLLSLEDKYGIKTTQLVYLDQLSASSMDILVYAFSNTVVWQEWLAIKEDVILKIWEILEAHNLEFAFPSQSLYFDKENVNDTLSKLVKSADE
ncbi:MAG: mechanosensitive ion channel, partial [Campylobacterota bacterium]|nr:mechanosensitive ion channel [Campylobacterota bacterium]